MKTKHSYIFPSIFLNWSGRTFKKHMYRPVHLTRKANLPASTRQQPAGLMPVPQVRQGQCRGHFFPPSFPPHSCLPPHPPPPWAAVPSGHYQLSHGATCSTGLTAPLSQLFLPFLTQDFPEAPTCSCGRLWWGHWSRLELAVSSMGQLQPFLTGAALTAPTLPVMHDTVDNWHHWLKWSSREVSLSIWLLQSQKYAQESAAEAQVQAAGQQGPIHFSAAGRSLQLSQLIQFLLLWQHIYYSKVLRHCGSEELIEMKKVQQHPGVHLE